MFTIDEKLLEVLEKDFEELSKKDIQILRKETRRKYGINLTNNSNPNLLLNSYLNFKRKYVSRFDYVFISPKQTIKDFGPFSGEKVVYNRFQIPTFDGFYGSIVGMFYIDEYICLPVLTVSYFDDFTEIICLSPEWNFCKLSDKIFDFEI